MKADIRRRARVLVLTTWFPSASTPSEAPFNLEHVQALNDFADVEVLHVRIGSKERDESGLYHGIMVHRIALDPKRPLTFLKVLMSSIQKMRGRDVLHTMAFSSALVAAPAWLTTRPAWIHTEHWNGVTKPESVGGWWARMAWLRVVLKLPRIVTGVTTDLCDALAAFSRSDASRLVPCVVENPRPVVMPPGGDVLRLVAVGGLIPRKRPLLALETVAELVRRGRRVHLTWVGGGPLEATVRDRVLGLGLENMVTLTGAVVPDRIFGFLEGADIFFLPTAQENFFTSAAEALSCGRPVVAPLVGGYHDYCNPGNSVLVSDPTAASLADAIEQAAVLAREVAPVDLATDIRKRFSRQAVAAAFRDLYEEMLSPRVRSGEAA